MKPFIFLLLFSLGFIQNIISKNIDSLNIENEYSPFDQIYLSFQFSSIAFSDNQIENNMLSSPGFSFGFIKDYPIDKDSRYAWALGVDYTLNTYFTNLLYYYDPMENTTVEYNLVYANEIEQQRISKNTWDVSYLSALFEFRFRSNPRYESEYIKVYTGFQLGYVLDFDSNYQYNNHDRADENISIGVNPWRYGLRLTLGYHWFNVYGYYGLNQIFQENSRLKISQKVSDVSNLLNEFNFGVLLYIL